MTDSKNRAQYKVSSDGQHLKTLLASKIGALIFSGIGVCCNNTVYVCDSGRHQIYVLSDDLDLVKTFGGQRKWCWRVQCP